MASSSETNPSLIISGILILIIGLLAGWLFGTNQGYFKSKTGTKSTLPFQCQYDDNSLCGGESEVKNIIKSGDYQKILELQNTVAVTCDDQTLFNPNMCEGVENGTILSGYVVGENQGEGTTFPKAEFEKFLADRFAKNSPYRFIGTVEGLNMAMIITVSKDNNDLLAFPLKKTGNEWKMDYILIGVPSEDFMGLKQEILGYIR